MTDITIPESTLKDIVASQLAIRFSDPEIIQNFVGSILESRVDSYGRVSSRPTDPTMIRWAIEQVIRNFVEETAKAWIMDQHDTLISMIGEELTKADLIRKIAIETASKVGIR